MYTHTHGAEQLRDKHAGRCFQNSCTYGEFTASMV